MFLLKFEFYQYSSTVPGREYALRSHSPACDASYLMNKSLAFDLRNRKSFYINPEYKLFSLEHLSRIAMFYIKL